MSALATVALIVGTFVCYFGGIRIACRRSARFDAFLTDLLGPERGA